MSIFSTKPKIGERVLARGEPGVYVGKVNSITGKVHRVNLDRSGEAVIAKSTNAFITKKQIGRTITEIINQSIPLKVVPSSSGRVLHAQLHIPGKLPLQVVIIKQSIIVPFVLQLRATNYPQEKIEKMISIALFLTDVMNCSPQSANEQGVKMEEFSMLRRYKQTSEVAQNTDQEWGVPVTLVAWVISD